MKSITHLHSLVLIAFIALIATNARSSEQQTQKRHRFVCIDNLRNNLILVDQFEPERSWTRQIPAGSRDIQILNSNTLLVSHGNGAAEYDSATGESLTWKVDRYTGVQSAQRLPNGNTALISIQGLILILDPKGEELSKTAIQIPDLNLRLGRFLENGNLLIGATNPHAVIEARTSGEVVRIFPLLGKGYKALQISNGHILSSTGDDCKVVELDGTGKIVSFVGGKDEHPDLGLNFASGWDLLPNGNIVLANWLGHGKNGTGAHLVEFTRENKVVWKWVDHDTAAQTTNLKILK